VEKKILIRPADPASAPGFGDFNDLLPMCEYCTAVQALPEKDRLEKSPHEVRVMGGYEDNTPAG
jgi:hypothetical protein